jgi:hypothetical protein
VKKENESVKLNRKEMQERLENMIETIDNLPIHAKMSPITHYDYVWLLSLLSSLLQQDLD